MNTIAYTPSSSLSYSSIDLLEINGYRSRFSEEFIQFKRKYDFIGPFIIVFLYAMVALPIFAFSYGLGILVLVTILAGIIFHRRLSSKSSTIDINSEERLIEVRNRFGKSSFDFDQVESVFVKSSYNGSYASADKRTMEEYDIVIGVLLQSEKKLNLFFYKSDVREPNAEIMEVHDYLKSVLSS